MTAMRPGTVQRGRATVERVEQVSAKDTWVTGSVFIEGIGESVVDITFPLLFGEEPLPILGGGVLLADAAPQRYNFPTVQMMVVQFHTSGPHWTGAQLSVVATGRADQKIRATFAFVGLGLSSTQVSA